MRTCKWRKMWMKKLLNKGGRRESENPKRNQEEKPREKRKPGNEGFLIAGVYKCCGKKVTFLKI